MTNGELFQLIKNTLNNGENPDFEFDSRCIFEDITGLSALDLALNREKEADGAAAEKALKLAKRRSEGYPLQYLLDPINSYLFP